MCEAAEVIGASSIVPGIMVVSAVAFCVAVIGLLASRRWGWQEERAWGYAMSACLFVYWTSYTLSVLPVLLEIVQDFAMPPTAEAVMPEDLSAADASDYYAWRRLRGLENEDSPTLRRRWATSKKKGQHCRLLDARRRKEFSPGKYYAATQAGWYLNKRFVKGWSGVNPEA